MVRACYRYTFVCMHAYIHINIHTQVIAQQIIVPSATQPQGAAATSTAPSSSLDPSSDAQQTHSDTRGSEEDDAYDMGEYEDVPIRHAHAIPTQAPAGMYTCVRVCVCVCMYVGQVYMYTCMCAHV